MTSNRQASTQERDYSKMLIQTRFSDWDAIWKTPAPDPKLPTTTALWHFARGVAMSSDKSLGAYAATGKLEDAASESRVLLAAKEEFTIQIISNLSVAPLLYQTQRVGKRRRTRRR